MAAELENRFAALVAVVRVGFIPLGDAVEFTSGSVDEDEGMSGDDVAEGDHRGGGGGEGDDDDAADVSSEAPISLGSSAELVVIVLERITNALCPARKKGLLFGSGASTEFHVVWPLVSLLPEDELQNCAALIDGALHSVADGAVDTDGLIRCDGRERVGVRCCLLQGFSRVTSLRRMCDNTHPKHMTITTSQALLPSSFTEWPMRHIAQGGTNHTATDGSDDNDFASLSWSTIVLTDSPGASFEEEVLYDTTQGDSVDDVAESRSSSSAFLASPMSVRGTNSSLRTVASSAMITIRRDDVKNGPSRSFSVDSFGGCLKQAMKQSSSDLWSFQKRSQNVGITASSAGVLKTALLLLHIRLPFSHPDHRYHDTFIASMQRRVLRSVERAAMQFRGVVAGAAIISSSDGSTHHRGSDSDSNHTPRGVDGFNIAVLLPQLECHRSQAAGTHFTLHCAEAAASIHHVVVSLISRLPRPSSLGNGTKKVVHADSMSPLKAGQHPSSKGALFSDEDGDDDRLVRALTNTSFTTCLSPEALLTASPLLPESPLSDTTMDCGLPWSAPYTRTCLVHGVLRRSSVEAEFLPRLLQHISGSHPSEAAPSSPAATNTDTRASVPVICGEALTRAEAMLHASEFGRRIGDDDDDSRSWCICEEPIGHWLEVNADSIEIHPPERDTASSGIYAYFFMELTRTDPSTGHGSQRVAQSMCRQHLKNYRHRKLIGACSVWQALGNVVAEHFHQVSSSGRPRHVDPILSSSTSTHDEPTKPSPKTPPFRVVTLSGPPMCGKSSVLMQCAAHLGLASMVVIDAHSCRPCELQATLRSPWRKRRSSSPSSSSPSSPSGGGHSSPHSPLKPSDILAAAAAPLLCVIFAQMTFFVHRHAEAQHSERSHSSDDNVRYDHRTHKRLLRCDATTDHMSLADVTNALVALMTSFKSPQWVILIDDLHLILEDSVSIRLLSEVVERVHADSGIHVLVVATCTHPRPAALSKWLRRVEGPGAASHQPAMCKAYIPLEMEDHLESIGDVESQLAAVYGAVVQCTGQALLHEGLRRDHVSGGTASFSQGSAEFTTVRASTTLQNLLQCVATAGANSLLGIVTVSRALADRHMLLSLLLGLRSDEFASPSQAATGTPSPQAGGPDLIPARRYAEVNLREHLLEEESKELRDILLEWLSLLSRDETAWIVRVACFCAAMAASSLSLDDATQLTQLVEDADDDSDGDESLSHDGSHSVIFRATVERLQRDAEGVESAAVEAHATQHASPLGLLVHYRRHAKRFYFASAFVAEIVVSLFHSEAVRQTCNLISVSKLYDDMSLSGKLWVVNRLGRNEDRSLLTALRHSFDAYESESLSRVADKEQLTEDDEREHCRCCLLLQRIVTCTPVSSDSGDCGDLQQWFEGSATCKQFREREQHFQSLRQALRKERRAQVGGASVVAVPTLIPEVDVALEYLLHAWRKVESLWRRHQTTPLSVLQVGGGGLLREGSFASAVSPSPFPSFSMPPDAAADTDDVLAEAAARSRRLCLEAAEALRFAALTEWDSATSELNTSWLLCQESIEALHRAARTLSCTGGSPHALHASSSSSSSGTATVMTEMSALVANVVSAALPSDVSGDVLGQWRDVNQGLSKMAGEASSVFLKRIRALSTSAGVPSTSEMRSIEAHLLHGDDVRCSLLHSQVQRVYALWTRWLRYQGQLGQDEGLTKTKQALLAQQEAALSIRELLSLLLQFCVESRGCVTVVRDAQQPPPEPDHATGNEKVGDTPDSQRSALWLHEVDLGFEATTAAASAACGIPWRAFARFTREVSHRYLSAACETDAHARSNRGALAADYVRLMASFLFIHRDVVLKHLSGAIVSTVGDIRRENTMRLKVEVCRTFASPFTDGMWSVRVDRVAEPPSRKPQPPVGGVPNHTGSGATSGVSAAWRPRGGATRHRVTAPPPPDD